MWISVVVSFSCARCCVFFLHSSYFGPKQPSPPSNHPCSLILFSIAHAWWASVSDDNIAKNPLVGVKRTRVLSFRSVRALIPAIVEQMDSQWQVVLHTMEKANESWCLPRRRCHDKQFSPQINFISSSTYFLIIAFNCWGWDALWRCERERHAWTWAALASSVYLKPIWYLTDTNYFAEPKVRSEDISTQHD